MVALQFCHVTLLPASAFVARTCFDLHGFDPSVTTPMTALSMSGWVGRTVIACPRARRRCWSCRNGDGSALHWHDASASPAARLRMRACAEQYFFGSPSEVAKRPVGKDRNRSRQRRCGRWHKNAVARAVTTQSGSLPLPGFVPRASALARSRPNSGSEIQPFTNSVATCALVDVRNIP